MARTKCGRGQIGNGGSNQTHTPHDRSDYTYSQRTKIGSATRYSKRSGHHSSSSSRISKAAPPNSNLVEQRTPRIDVLKAAGYGDAPLPSDKTGLGKPRWSSIVQCGNAETAQMQEKAIEVAEIRERRCRFPLMQLPLEIRRKIYKEILYASGCSLEVNMEHYLATTKWNPDKQGQPLISAPFLPGICYLNNAILFEAAGVFLTLADIVIGGEEPGKKFQTWLRYFPGESGFKCVRNLHVDSPHVSKFKTSGTRMDMVLNCPGLISLSLVIRIDDLMRQSGGWPLPTFELFPVASVVEQLNLGCLPQKHLLQIIDIVIIDTVAMQKSQLSIGSPDLWLSAVRRIVHWMDDAFARERNGRRVCIQWATRCLWFMNFIEPQDYPFVCSFLRDAHKAAMLLR